jgi:invasion protein IalB
MHFASLKRLAFYFLLALAAMASTAAVAASAAQPTQVNVRSKHGAWSVICNTPPGAAEEQCAMIQNVVAEDRPEIGLSVMVFKTADRKQRILRVIAPLGVLLSTSPPVNGGLGLIIDKQNLHRIDFIRCFSDGCYAESTLTDELLKLFRNGTNAIFSVKESADAKAAIGLDVDLKGFAEAYDSLP